MQTYPPVVCLIQFLEGRIRHIQGRYIWDDVIAAWEAQDINALDDVWLDVIQDLDSMYAAYAYVSAVSIGA